MVSTGDVGRRRRGQLVGLAVLCVTGLGLVACGDDDTSASTGGDTVSSGAGASAIPDSPAAKLRLGYFPNLTHAPAIVGVENGIFAKHLSEGGDSLETKTFNAGPNAVTEILAGTLDATFIGPNPSINAFVQSQADDPNGKIRIIAGTTSGGAYLVTKPEIASLADLKGKTVATPQKGNTQDVALRAHLKEEAIAFDTGGGDSVTIKPQENADTLTQFATGDLAGAWVPEPFATRMIQESGGKILIDESTLWPETDGRYVTTDLLVTTDFLSKHPDVIKELLDGLSESIEFVNSNTAEAQKITNAGIEKLTTKPLKDAVLQAAWENLEFTLDPVPESLKGSADDAVAVGIAKEPVKNLPRLYDLSVLNAVLQEQGKPEVVGL